MPLIETRGALTSRAYGEFSAPSVVPNYIEDVFSTYLYKGTAGSQYIDNSIQLETTLNAIVYQRSFVQEVANTTVATQAGDVLVMFSRVPFGSATLTINSASISPVNSLVDTLNYTNSVFISTLSTSSTNIVTNSPGVGIHSILIIRGASNVSLANAISESGSSSTTTGSISSSGFGLFWGNDRDPYQNITGGLVTVTSGYNQYFSSNVMSYNGNGTTIPATTFSGFGTTYNHTYAVVKVEGLTATPTTTQGFGGLVWIKNRTSATDHRFLDTTRPAFQYLQSNGTASSTNFTPFQQFSRGFTITGSDGTVSSATGDNYASWTFRKQAKFFDIVNYTGNGSGSRLINHSLGSAPGLVIIKALNATSNWPVMFAPTSGNAYGFSNAYSGGGLNTNAAGYNLGSVSGVSTATQFRVGSSYWGNTSETNDSGVNYIAYVFANNAGGFGAFGTENAITCGTYAGNGSTTGPIITLGYEPQFLLIKNREAGTYEDWVMVDTMRGLSVNGPAALLYADVANSEGPSNPFINVSATGFQPVNSSSRINASGNNYMYMAIRRGPMRTPTSGTSVFSPNTSSTFDAVNTTGFAIDAQIWAVRGGVLRNSLIVDRLRGVGTGGSSNDGAFLSTALTDAEIAGSQNSRSWDNTGFRTPGYAGSVPEVFWSFRRASGFFDVVCYTGTGSNTTVNHSLGVVPEMILLKDRTTAGTYFCVYHSSMAAGSVMYLSLDFAETANSTIFTTTAPTSSVFSVGTNANANASGDRYVAYLFSTVAGVSKVGTYTGTGTTQQINCGFTGGARFVMIKRKDSTGDWYVWDSARGIVAGNDPYLLLNSTAAEVTNTDYIDTLSTGFEISSTAPAAINANGGTYIFLAIA